MQINKNQYNKGIVFAATTTLFWGFLPIALTYALQFNSVKLVVAFRFVFSFLALLFFYLKTDPHLLRILIKPPLIAIISALGLTLNYWGYLECIRYTGPANAQILIQTAPLMLAFLGIVYFKETLNNLQKLGLLFSLSGFLFFYSDQLSSYAHNISTYSTGNWWIFLASTSWVAWAFFNKKASQNYKPQQLNLVTFAVGAIFFVPQANLSELASSNPLMWAALTFLGINTLVAYGLLSEAIKLIPANTISFIVTLNPLITLLVINILSAFNYHWLPVESISAKGYLGALFLISGVILITQKRLRKS